MNKCYMRDWLYAYIIREPQHTSWIAVINDDSGNPEKATPFVYNSHSINKKLSSREPIEFEWDYPACDIYHWTGNPIDKKKATYIPFLSTEKGWKWNRRQVLSLLQKYPNTSKYLLNGYLNDPFLQIRLKKVMGKHFRAFVREIKNILPDVSPDYITNFTSRKVSRDEYLGNSMLMMLYVKINGISVYGAINPLTSHEDDLRFLPACKPAEL